jgi:hypothetical protein
LRESPAYYPGQAAIFRQDWKKVRKNFLANTGRVSMLSGSGYVSDERKEKSGDNG